MLVDTSLVILVFFSYISFILVILVLRKLTEMSEVNRLFYSEWQTFKTSRVLGKIVQPDRITSIDWVARILYSSTFDHHYNHFTIFKTWLTKSKETLIDISMTATKVGRNFLCKYKDVFASLRGTSLLQNRNDTGDAIQVP